MSNQRQTKTYKLKEKKKCTKCGHKGRDVHARILSAGRSKLLCNNCLRAMFI